MSNIFKKNKLISLLLVFVLIIGILFSTAIPVCATEINRSDGSGKSKVVTTITPAKFNVTVPYVLPISIDSDQNVYTADNVRISNNSNGPINVSYAWLMADNNWEIVDTNTDFQSVPVNSKKFSMSIQNTPVLNYGFIDTNSFDTINGNSSLKIDYDADAAVQSNEISGEEIAYVVFTIEWDSIEITKSTISNTALKAFIKNVTTFQKTSEKMNIDDVKAINGAKKIDDGRTSKSIYAWSDSNGNGYWWTDAMVAYLSDGYRLFFDYTNLTYLDLSDFDATYVTDMKEMYRGCSSLKTLKMPYNTQNVQSMYNICYDCSSLKKLDASNVNTRNVTIMTGAFAFCESLESLDLSSFNTYNVYAMAEMFKYCTSLKYLNISTWDTRNVTTMIWMFTGCESLESLDLSSFAFTKVNDMSYFVEDCSNLITIYVSNFATTSLKSGGDTEILYFRILHQNMIKSTICTLPMVRYQNFIIIVQIY